MCNKNVLLYIPEECNARINIVIGDIFSNNELCLLKYIKRFDGEIKRATLGNK